MQNILTGIILMILGVAVLLEQWGVVTVFDDLDFLWPAIVVLIGLFMVLRAQAMISANHARRKVEKQKAKMEKNLKKQHNQEKEALEHELDEKTKQVEEAEEVIDDMINPKIDPKI